MRRPDQSCRECGSLFSAQRATREFCCTRCRTKFHNRRSVRGAEFYDLVMSQRHDRVAAKQAGAWSLMSRMAAAFRLEDVRDRGGRKSWDDIAKVKVRSARLNATVVGLGVAGARRKKS
jgi:hypothetical protein